MAKKKPFNHSMGNYETSVVKIMNTGIEHDYEKPWKAPDSQHCAGSGFIIQDPTGKKYILSNAHVVENSTYTEIQLSNEDSRYEATIKHFGHDCDLALLDVDNPEFWEKTKPLSIGKMVKHNQDIKVVGFPIGGEEVSITQGIVSRIEIEEYSHSYRNLLQVQVDAAINSGNSGGPVFYKNKVVGVAFQGIEEGDGLGYMIPTPIIKHFLAEAFKNEPYQGFPIPDFSVQKINNQALRKELNMEDEQTGILVTKIPPLSYAHSILQENDVLLSIENHILKNDGFINLPFDKHIHFSYLFHQKYFGECIKLKILRNGSTLNIQLKLNKNSVGTKIILPYERDKPPSFYISSGIIFQPITQNYLESSSGQDLISSGQIKEDELRKNLEQQAIIINSVLACKKTSGYLEFSNSIINKINNTKINNLFDVIKIIEESQAPRLIITTKNNELIVIEKMTPKEQLALLKTKYGITTTCSKDLIAYHNQYLAYLNQTMKNEEKEETDNNSDNTWHSSDENEMEIAPELLKAINKSSPKTSTLFYKNLKQKKRAKYPEDISHLEFNNTPPPKKRKFQ